MSGPIVIVRALLWV